MRKKNIFSILLSFLLVLSQAILPASMAHAAQAADWTWLLEQVASGRETVSLPNSIACPEDAQGLHPEGTVRIEGNGFSLTGALIDGGTVIFKDTVLQGVHGLKAESGGDALTLHGDGTVAVLMGVSRAEGGRSGPEGEQGGSGVRMVGNRQGLIVNGTSTVVGGIGHLYGGPGVAVSGCESSLMVTDKASLIGSPGLAVAGAGLSALSCTTAAFSKEGAATGGASVYVGGSGVHVTACPLCAQQGEISMADAAMAIGGVGQDGGHGLDIAKNFRTDTPDLRFLPGACMVIGGDGAKAGSAIQASVITIDYGEGGAQLFGGRYYEIESPALSLFGCETIGNEDALTIHEGEKTDTYPASGVSSIINGAVNRQSDRYEPEIIEDGLAAMELATKLNGFTVERGTVAQARVNDGGLKIFMYAGDLQKRLHFQQRLMEAGDGGMRLVLIASVSDMWPTIDCSVGALRKLDSLGFTQLAYTCIAPVYHEQVLDLATLIAAIDADEGEVSRVMCGTADDAIIFIYEDGTRDYQETLMPEVSRPVTE